MPYQLIYSSEASAQLTDEDLAQILEESRVDNAARGVTGALLFVDRVFVQILEGSEEAVSALMEKIDRDPRHDNITVFHTATATERVFDDWRMAFLNPDPAEVARWAALPGTASMAEIVATLEANPDRVPDVLRRMLRLLSE